MAELIHTPVLIAGAGPVGLAVALDLGRRGVDCMLIDETDGEMIHSKIGYIAVRTMEFFRRWGIAQSVRDAFPDDFRMSRVVCTDVKRPPLHVDEVACFRDMPVPDYSPEKKQRCPQHWLQPILQKAALAQASVKPRYQCRLERFEQHAGHVDVEALDVAKNEKVRIRAQYLIACDGIESTVREALGIGMTGKPKLSYSLGITVSVPDFMQHCHYGAAERFIFIGPEGTWGNLTTVNGRDQWRLTVIGSEEKLDLANLDIRYWMRRVLGRDAPFEVLAVLPWRRREQIADRFQSGRVLLAGDSVHAMSPTGGMGMNTGIGDAVDLGWKLQAMVEGWGGERLMDSYEIERKPVAVRNASASTDNFKVLTSPKDCAAILDDTDEGERVRQKISAEFTAAMNARYWEPSGIQMGYRYDGSPVIVPDDSPEPEEQVKYVQTARPGARAPHAWLADGRSTLDLFGRDFVLLQFGAAAAKGAAEFAAAAKQRRVPLTITLVEDAAIAQLYDAPLVLVRPDGHVAWRGDGGGDALRVMDCVRGAAS